MATGELALTVRSLPPLPKDQDHAMASNIQSRVLRISCPNFCAEEINALRSLCNLLKAHLKQPWEIVSGHDADLVLLNLDAGDTSAHGSAMLPVVGCALRPRMHAQGTIHRPLRASEILAVLSDLGERAGRPFAQQNDVGARADGRYRLQSWPIEFEHWPEDWLGVLAAMTRSARSLRNIAECTGLAPEEVGRCVALLGRQGLLDIVESRIEQTTKQPETTGRWQQLASKVGQMLGFA